MKRLLALTLVAGLMVAAIAAPAVAAKKKKKKAKPVETTLYLHGTERFGEMESFSFLADAFLPMDATEPEGSETKSKQITNYTIGPNYNCAGNTLWPVWTGDLAGQVVGDITVKFTAAGTPGKVDVRLWSDVAALMCNEDFPEPIAEAAGVDLPAGQGEVEAVIEDVNFLTGAILMLQVQPSTMDVGGQNRAWANTFFSRILYDSTAAPSSLTFDCIPAKGNDSCTP